jgi:hypothetical protein
MPLIINHKIVGQEYKNTENNKTRKISYESKQNANKIIIQKKR